MKQYVHIKDGVIDAEGALPLFWESSPANLVTKSPEELSELGWKEIVEVDKRDSFDTEIQGQVASQVIIVDGIPTRKWSYPFLDGVVAIFLERNNKKAEELRKSVLTQDFGKSLEYEILSKEAEQYLKDTQPNVINYPLLFSTISSDLTDIERFDAAKLEAAKILSKRGETIRMLAFIRATRKSIENRLINETDTQKLVYIEKDWQKELIKFKEFYNQ